MPPIIQCVFNGFVNIISVGVGIIIGAMAMAYLLLAYTRVGEVARQCPYEKEVERTQ